MPFFTHFFCVESVAGLNVKEPNAEVVILLHGLARTNRSMDALASRIRQAGFEVLNIDYPSRKHPIEELGKQIGRRVGHLTKSHTRRVHFVTHSMGGILVRWLHKHMPIQNMGRVVMLSPPNKGSEVVDNLKNFIIFRWIMGPSLLQLGSDTDGLPAQLGPVDFELGVIAGSRSLNPIFSYWLTGEDDGKVSTESAKIEGMNDFLEVPFSHGFIMRREEVAEQVIAFLRTGRFDHFKTD